MKTYKAVLKSSLVMLSLLALAVVSSSVAQAQTCHVSARRVSGSSHHGSRRGHDRTIGGHRIAMH